MNKLILIVAMVISVMFSFSIQASENINMTEIRDLAKRPVEDILSQSPVIKYDVKTYWKSIHGRQKPLVVLFYSNHDGPSQRLATLIKYIAPHYSDKMSFGRVRVIEKGKPDHTLSKEYLTLFGLDHTPGILFYDNSNGEMIVENEDYIDADFKEFRTPKLFLWKTYYAAVRKELDKLLSD